ncbi:MAG: hypothetical protein ACO25B_00085 [Chitinophagaceae bacterium]
MKCKTVLFVLLSIFFVCQAVSQGTGEKVYVQTDRREYQAGETIYFKGFVFSAVDSIESTNFFIELWDAGFQKLEGICLPVIDGTASGSIRIPASVDKGPVFLRAYTDITASWEQPDQFIKAVTGGGEAATLPTDAEPQFFPEGGQLVYNAINHLVYQVPGITRGIIRSSNGDTIAVLNPVFNGLGSCSFTALAGEIYTCEYQQGGRTGKITLPYPVFNGIAVHLRQSPDTLFFDLDNGGTREKRLQSPRIQLMINGEPVYLITANMSAVSRFSYFIPLKDYHTGLAELRVLDADERPVARRQVFIARHSFDNDLQIEFLKKGLAEREENQIRLRVRDSSIRYVSVSITDADISKGEEIPGMLPAFIDMPFRKTAFLKDPGNREAVDLAVQTLPIGLISFSAGYTGIPSGHPQYLQLNGSVKKGKKPLVEKELLVGIRSAYTGNELYKLKTDADGRFVLNGLIVYGEAFVHCRLPGNSTEELIHDFRLTLPVSNQEKQFLDAFQQEARSMIPADPVPVISTETVAPDTLVFDQKVITLPEVVVKADNNLLARKRLEDLENKYAGKSQFSGYFATSESLDVLNDPRSATAVDLFSYIGQQMRGVTLRFVRGTKQLFCYGRGTGGETMITVFYLGNSRVDRDMLNSVFPDQVALIKFIPMLGFERGFPPAIIIFLKKPGDEGYWEKERFQLIEDTIRGYPITRELPEPDYSQDTIKVEKDYRKTVFWRPYVPVENGEAEIRFYNNDRSRRLRFVLEGIARDGSIIRFEQLLE